MAFDNYIYSLLYNMDPRTFYISRLESLNTELARLKRKKSALAWLRLGPVLAIVAAFYFLWSLGFIYVLVAAILLLIIFVRLIHIDLDNQAAINHRKELIRINENEIKALDGHYLQFANGEEHISRDHPYTNDLDIFGRASLFQYINRTSSEPGSKKLANYLKAPASRERINERQRAAAELSKKVQWIQELQAEGNKNTITFHTKENLERWMKTPPVFAGFKPWRWLRYVLPVIILTVITLYIFHLVSGSLLLLTLLVFAVISYQLNKYVAPIHAQLTNAAGELQTLSSAVRLLEKESFTSSLLQTKQASFLFNNSKASLEISKITKALERLDLRYNIVISAPLNLLLLWNLQQVLDLEKWKKDHQDVFDSWFNSLASFEALNSFALLHFNHPSWVFPEIHEEYFSIHGKEIGHPLIPVEKRVNNFIDIDNSSQLMLVTGSNMAGKSTYLRSIGVNVVLAMAGAPVCADQFSVSHAEVISSMRISDNLEESTSTFYAELKKLKTIIDKVNAGEKVFILLDEILRGTNSLDRHTGSKALIRQLITHKAAAIIATHDLELARLKEDYSSQIMNYHFDVQVSGEELYFDYLLKPGICNSLNASILMKKIGIELE